MFVNKLRSFLMGIVALVSSFWAGTAAAEWRLNLTQGVTPISREVYDLHMLILWIVTIIGVVVFGVIFWSVYYHRKSRGAIPAQFHHSTVAELSWTIIPILILVGMAIPATKTLIMMEQTGDADITVKITGHQWKWKYDYVNEGLSFFSVLDQASNDARQLGANVNPGTVEHYLLNVDKPVVLPVNKKIRQNQFGFDDFLKQMEQIKKMGSLKDIMGMIPGMGKAIKDVDIDDDSLKPIEAIIKSMTPIERENPDVINGSRRQRIAKGSGTSIQEVNQLLKQFTQMRKMMKTMNKMGGAKALANLMR